MENFVNIKDLYLSPDFVTEKTVNAALSGISDNSQNSSFSPFTEGASDFFAKNESANGQSEQDSSHASQSGTEQNRSFSETSASGAEQNRNFSGGNAQGAGQNNASGSPANGNIQGHPDTAPDYGFSESSGIVSDKPKKSKEYIAYEQYRKYIEKHDKYAQMAKGKK